MKVFRLFHTHTHTRARAVSRQNLVNCRIITRLTAPFSGTTQVSQYQKGETNLDFTEARDSEWQWHQLGHMQVCTSLQADNHAGTPPLSFLQAGCPSRHWRLLWFHTKSRILMGEFVLCLCAFSALTLLVGRQEGHPLRPVKNWVLGYWHGYLSGARCRLAYGPADATATEGIFDSITEIYMLIVNSWSIHMEGSPLRIIHYFPCFCAKSTKVYSYS